MSKRKGINLSDLEESLDDLSDDITNIDVVDESHVSVIRDAVADKKLFISIRNSKISMNYVDIQPCPHGRGKLFIISHKSPLRTEAIQFHLCCMDSLPVGQSVNLTIYAIATKRSKNLIGDASPDMCMHFNPPLCI
jgi:hypothetical protein